MGLFIPTGWEARLRNDMETHKNLNNLSMISHNTASNVAKESWNTGRSEGIRDTINKLYELGGSSEIIDSLIKEFYDDIVKGTTINFTPGEPMDDYLRYLADRDLFDSKYSEKERGVNE